MEDNQENYHSYVYRPNSFEYDYYQKYRHTDRTLPVRQKPEIYWYQNDHLGTPHCLTDAHGQAVWKSSYLAFGSIKTEANNGAGIDNPLRFAGQYHDRETGLFYNLNRYYDPAMKRYLTQDPVGLLGGLNPYLYVSANPTRNIDPLGLFSGLGDQSPENSWNAFQEAHKGQFGDSKEAAAAYEKLKREQSPWPIGYEPSQREIQVGERFNMALSPEQLNEHPGGFGTFDNIPDESYIRNELAVKEQWKSEIDRIATYEVTNPFDVLTGTVGPQVDGSVYLPGGGSQIEILLPRNERMSYLKLISIKKDLTMEEIHIINKDKVGVKWEYNGDLFFIPFIINGRAIYSNFYNLIIVMNYDIKGLDMKAYKLNGELVSQISPHKSDIVLYSYLSKNKHVKSGVTVVAGYKEKVDNFYDWQFEVDLDKFEITNRIAPSY